MTALSLLTIDGSADVTTITREQYLALRETADAVHVVAREPKAGGVAE